MPKTYGRDVRLRAVALAEVRSIPVASKELSIPIDTVARWVEEEPRTPALQRAVDLALSELTARIADGTIKGRDLTVAYGVLRDKWARYGSAERHQPEAQSPAERAIDELEGVVAKLYPGVDLDEIIAILLTHERLTEADDESLPSEDGQAVIDSWLATLARLVEEHGSIEAVREWQRAEEHDRLEAQLARNAAVRDAAIASARQAQLDDEVRGLLQAAQAILARGDDD